VDDRDKPRDKPGHDGTRGSSWATLSSWAYSSACGNKPGHDEERGALMPLLEVRNLTVRFPSRSGAFTAVDGVDVIHIGSNDLLTALGKPGRFDDPEIFSAIDRAIAAAKARFQPARTDRSAATAQATAAPAPEGEMPGAPLWAVPPCGWMRRPDVGARGYAVPQVPR